MALGSTIAVKLNLIFLREPTDEDLSKDGSGLVVLDQFPKAILGPQISPAIVAIISENSMEISLDVRKTQRPSAGSFFGQVLWACEAP